MATTRRPWRWSPASPSQYRKTFKKDVVIDIVCYRKLGHNEQDEPMVTQPLMYKKIQQHPGTRKLYADKLVAEGVLSPEGPDEIIADYRAHLDRGELLYNPVIAGYKHPMTIDWTPFLSPSYIENCDTKVPVAELQRLAERLTTIPANFTLHSRVKKIIDDRRLMGEGKLPVDWGMAENLAYASLLVSGYGVRISGEDVGRSTFFHRHAALHDQNREHWDRGTYYPLANLQDRQGGFQCFDSVLSEEAVLAFEYGYSTANPFELVVWEAQFGDFANGAQVVIDQFIASGEAKWGRASGLVLLLPHGYEGQGPEHSSARIERYMQLCGDEHGSLPAVDAGAGLPHAAPAGGAQPAQAADRLFAEVAAAPQGCDIHTRRTERRRVPAGDRRSRADQCQEGDTRRLLLRQGVL
jgi:2-oxoglutarate dehydrogenase E1 component